MGVIISEIVTLYFTKLCVSIGLCEMALCWVCAREAVVSPRRHLPPPLAQRGCIEECGRGGRGGPVPPSHTAITTTPLPQRGEGVFAKKQLHQCELDHLCHHSSSSGDVIP